MSEDSEDDLHLDILRLQLRCDALESLCLALVTASTNKAYVVALFEAHRMGLENQFLNSTEISDVAVQETLRAHAAIAGLLSPPQKPS